MRTLFQYMLLLRGATEYILHDNSNKRFQYMLLLRGATQQHTVLRRRAMFQYMLLLRGATWLVFKSSLHKCSFNTCSSCEEQPSHRRSAQCTCSFQYMLLLRGATARKRPKPSAHTVSIHAPLARSNSVSPAHPRLHNMFQYMLLLRGATYICTI